MGKSTSTKQNLFKAYKDCLARGSQQDASVQKITETCGMSRRAFYYHFDDCAQLAQWGFRFEIAQLLKQNCPASSLVRPGDQTNDMFPELPFYARSAAGIRSLDCSLFFKSFYEYLDENRQFYKTFLETSIAGSFMRYLDNLYFPAFCFDVTFIAGGRKISSKVVAKIARRATYQMVISCFDQMRFSRYPLLDSTPKELSNANHEALYSIVNKYFDSIEIPYRMPDAPMRHRP